ncbi:unnamed protein product, partial [Meganyctiphanes norvegica]
GLFQGVIGQSGSALEHWALDSDPLESAEVIGSLNGCDTVSRETLYECMMTKTGDEMAMAMAAYVNHDRRNAGMGFRGASPVNQLTIDSNFTSNASIIIEKEPEQYFLDNTINSANLMIGANKNEGSYVMGIVYLDYLLPNALIYDDIWMRDEMVHAILASLGVEDPTNGLAESLMDAYLGGADPANFEEFAIGAIDMTGVLFLKAGIWQTAKLHSKHSIKNTYVYSFDFQSDDTMFSWLFIGHSDMPFETG